MNDRANPAGAPAVDAKESAMERAGEVWSCPQAKAASNAALAARVAELECELAQRAVSGEAKPVAYKIEDGDGVAIVRLAKHVEPHRLIAVKVTSLYDHPPAQSDSSLVTRLTHERDTLGQAIADAAKKAGIYNGEVALTGPHLVMFANDLAECAMAQPDSERDAAPPAGWREALQGLRDNTETFGPYSQEAARIAIEGCIDALDELAHLPAADGIQP